MTACTCMIGGHDHSADCAVEVERRDQPKAPIVCVFALIWRNGRVLLGERVDFGWGIPGGKCDAPGRLEEHLRREVREETGLTDLYVSEMPWWHEFTHPDGQIYACVHYSAALRGWTWPAIMEPDKCLRWDWFRPDELPENTMPQVEDAIKFSLALKDL